MMSLLLNELYGFQFDNRHWYPLELRKEKSAKTKLKKCLSENSDAAPLDCKVVSVDKDEDFEDNEGDDMDSSIDSMSLDLKKSMTVDDGALATTSAAKPQVSSSTSAVQSSVLPEASEPEWIEASDGEDEDDDDEEDDSEKESGSGDDSDETDDDDEKDTMDVDSRSTVEVGDAVAMLTGEGKILRRKEKWARIEQIRASLGLSDSQRTPVPGESLKDFYKRTNMHWQMAAYEHTYWQGTA